MVGSLTHHSGECLHVSVSELSLASVQSSACIILVWTLRSRDSVPSECQSQARPACDLMPPKQSKQQVPLEGAAVLGDLGSVKSYHRVPFLWTCPSSCHPSILSRHIQQLPNSGHVYSPYNSQPHPHSLKKKLKREDGGRSDCIGPHRTGRSNIFL